MISPQCNLSTPTDFDMRLEKEIRIIMGSDNYWHYKPNKKAPVNGRLFSISPFQPLGMTKWITYLDIPSRTHLIIYL